MNRFLVCALLACCGLQGTAANAQAPREGNAVPEARAEAEPGRGDPQPAKRRGEEKPWWAYVIGIAIVVTPIVLLIRWGISKARRFLNNWAGANGYKVVSAEHRWFAKGPYFWRSTKGQHIFRITVSDSSGVQHTGWARCGDFLFGTLVERVDVTWDSGRKVSWKPQITRRVDYAPTAFSLKKPTHWLWRTNFTREQVLQRLVDMEIDEDWLICPLGAADRAITVSQFASNPDAFGAKKNVTQYD